MTGFRRRARCDCHRPTPSSVSSWRPPGFTGCESLTANPYLFLEVNAWVVWTQLVSQPGARDSACKCLLSLILLFALRISSAHLTPFSRPPCTGSFTSQLKGIRCAERRESCSYCNAGPVLIGAASHSATGPSSSAWRAAIRTCTPLFTLACLSCTCQCRTTGHLARALR